MKDIAIALLVWGTVFLVGLAIVLFLNWGLEGYTGPGFCSLTDGSCYPK